MRDSDKRTLTLTAPDAVLQAGGGEVVLLRGDVGAGKSCWLKRMAGLLDMPTAMDCRLDGQDITGQSYVIRLLADRRPLLWLGQTVAEELLFGVRKAVSDGQLRQLLDDWGLTELATDSDVDQLNRLQALQLSIASMQLADSALVLLDNPTDGLPQDLAAEWVARVADWAESTETIVVVACNRWHDWRPRATQTWRISAADVFPTHYKSDTMR